ncbi:MAG: twin-arginine translocation signal domain-containing protein [SAR202 cluster bacterium]|nr:twin-arginine translocation signal domain-containing protein [SAR202 cluster bacterium]|tara:strand:- start:1661 stop:1876 length:216 start_codon:yes stop_codon:yes gene_type:complete
MPDQTISTHQEGVSRRGFLKRVALLGAAVSSLGLLSKGQILGVGRGKKSTPADLPGAGSIFQPRGDRRTQK